MFDLKQLYILSTFCSCLLIVENWCSIYLEKLKNTHSNECIERIYFRTISSSIMIYNLLGFILFYRITYDSFCSIKIKITTFDWLGFMPVSRYVVVEHVSVKERHFPDKLILSSEKFLSFYEEIIDAQRFLFYIILSNYLRSIFFCWDKHRDISRTWFHVCMNVHCCKRHNLT